MYTTYKTQSSPAAVLSPSHTIIGLEKGLRDVFHKVQIVANHPISVLITGETGTGKEVIARLLHSLSPRRVKTFIKVNCSAIPDHLLESELFGYVKGAFTGASMNKPGKIELAHEGTLFLDEIGDMKMDLQAKLLRVLQEKELERLGSNTPIHVDFRLITATNRDVQALVHNGAFREDLYYRIHTFPIHIPALRERREDIPDLVHYFLKTICREFELRQPHIAEATIKRLHDYAWPGNIRELENAMKRAVLVTARNDFIEERDFDFLGTDRDGHAKKFEIAIEAIRDCIIHQQIEVKLIEKYILNSIVEYYAGNIACAVKETGISKDKFYRSKKVFVDQQPDISTISA